MLVDWAHKFRTPGEWANLQESIQKQLKSFQPSEESAEYTFEFDTHYYFLVFATYDSDPAVEVVRIPVHKPALLQYSQRFPGIKSVVEVFVSVNPLATLSSSYLVTPKPNPIVASLPGFVKQFDVGKLLVVAAGTSLKARGMGGGTRIFVTESVRLAAKKMWFAPGAAGWTSTARTLVPETRAELGNANGPK